MDAIELFGQSGEIEMSSTRAEIIKYVKDTFGSIQKVPSTTGIVDNIQGLNSTRQLYEIFLGGLEEI